MTTEQPPAHTGGIGRARQDVVYRAGVLGRRPAVPTDPDELERRARRAMTAQAWAYVAGGAGSGATIRQNRAAFARHHLVPRMLHGTVRRDLGVSLLGTELAAPLLLAPVGAAALVRADSDVLIARGAAAAGVPCILSSQGCNPMEETAAALGDTPFWYQLYWSSHEPLVDSLIRRAEACGARALVVTLDTTVLGWRPKDLDLGSLPFSQGIGIAQYTSDPRFLALVDERVAAAEAAGPAASSPLTLGALRSLWSISRQHPGRLRDNLRSAVPRTAVQTFLDIYSNPGLSWEHLATLRDRTSLPVVLKGVLHPDDAVRALELGVDALIVSNHGGRQVDRAVASLDALVAVRAAVGPRPTVLLDSGIRSGADVLVALALGADACLLGRPHLYGLALAGADGVAQVTQDVLAELELSMALVGVPDITSITPALLQPAPAVG